MIKCRFTDCSNDKMIHHINQVGKLNIYGIDHSATFVPTSDLHHIMVTSYVKGVVESDKTIVVKTENSIYVFEKL